MPERTFPEFPAVLSFMVLLPADEVADELERRAARLRAEVAELEGVLAAAPVPRLFLVEDEYRLALLRAESDWVAAMVEDLRAGRLSWTEEWVRSVAAGEA